MSRLFSFFIGLAFVIKIFTSGQDLFGDTSDESLFSNPSQALQPLGPDGSLDLTDLTSGPKSLPFDDPRPILGDSSNLISNDPTPFGPDDFFSKLSDPFFMADCSSPDSSSILSSTTMGMRRSRSKRSDQCPAPPNSLNDALPSTPTVDDLDKKMRANILRTYPTLGDQLQLSQDHDDDDNSACVLLSGGIMPRGACTSATHWTYFGSGTFSWNSQYKLTLWDMYDVTPGMIHIFLKIKKITFFY